MACGSQDGAAPDCPTADTCAPCGDACGGDDVATPTTSEVGGATALLLPDGRVAVATYDVARGELVVVFQRPGGSERVVRTVATQVSGEAGRWARIALESGGGVQVAWFDEALGALRWARGSDAGFEPAQTVTTAQVSHLALAVDGDRPHIAFRDDATRTIRYAAQQGERWNMASVPGCAGEYGCPVAEAEDLGQGMDIALIRGAGGKALPRIAFYDALRGDLKLASLDDRGAWTTVTLDGRQGDVDTGDVGRFVSLAVTPTRSLGVAYFDATSGALRYLGPAGAPRVVDSGLVTLADGRARRVLVGQFCALRYDSQGAAHVLYVDSSTPGLRHARIPGEGAAVVTELAIPPGAWPSFDVVGDRLIGAYAAFITGLAPKTELRLFDVSAIGLPSAPWSGP